MADFSNILSKVKIQYPTDDPMSLQRSITQLKDLLENEEFYQALAESSGGVVIRILSGGSGGGGITLSFLNLVDTPGSYSGSGGKFVRVTNGETGLVFEDIEWDDVTDKPTEFPPEPHTHLEADITDLDKYTKAEVDASQAAQDQNLQDHEDDTGNPHETSWDNLLGKPAEFPPEDHTHVEAEITDLDRIRWIDPYVFGTDFLLNDMVRDGDWTMIANNPAGTTERAAPQEDGDPQWTLPDLPLWSYNQNESVVESGAQYEVTEPITLVGYQIWAPALSPDINYVIRTFAYPTDDPDKITYAEISEPLLTEDNWTTVAVSQALITAGTTIGLRVNALNSGGTTEVGPFDWRRDGNSNNSGPASGEWNRPNNNSALRISKTDVDGLDRTGDLAGIIAGSTISIVNKSDATESATYTTTSAESDEGDHYEWSVNVDDTGAGGEPAVGDVCVITITVPLPSPTDYVVNIGGHATQPNTIGYLAFDGVEQAGQEDNAFGVRILVDTWTISPDWDIVSLVGKSGVGGSGGGEGGVSEFISLIDTPASYVGQTGKVATVNVAENGLEFDTLDPVITEFIALTDTPISYAGETGKVARVNGAETALEFTQDAAPATTGPTFPTDPQEGDLHYMTAEPMGLYVWYVDVDSSQWVIATGGGYTPSVPQAEAFPVGSVYMSVIATDPATQLGYGTWAAMAEGRVLVGVGSNGESTWANGEERGSETHTLTTAQTPAHTHTVNPPNTNTTSAGAHTHTYSDYGSGFISAEGNNPTITVAAGTATTRTTSGASAHHTHAVNIAQFNSGSVGSGSAHNNVQPSFAVHMWTRTA